MTKRRHRRYEYHGEYNNRAERRRGVRVTAYNGDTILFRGRFKGYMKWAEKHAREDES